MQEKLAHDVVGQSQVGHGPPAPQETIRTPKEAWLATLKIGDKVVVQTYGLAGWRRITTVARLTRTQILVPSVGAPGILRRFRRDSGQEVGADRWNPTSLAPWSSAVEEEIRTDRMRARILVALRQVPRASLDKLTPAQCEMLRRVLVGYGLLEIKTKGPETAGA